MALSFFSKQKPNDNLVLLVDIGSASVGAALVSLEAGRPSLVRASVRENISFQDVLSSARFLFAMNQALDKVLATLQSNTKNSSPLKHVFCTLSSPWFILKTRAVHVAREQEFEFTENALEGFINEDIERLKEELKETLPPKDVQIIEKKVIHIKLNGYEVKNPYKQKTSQMDILMTVGVSSGRVIQSIERKINHYFHTPSVHFGVFPVAAFNAIRDIFPTQNDFLFADITGEASDVSMVNNDVLTNTVSFPRGKNFFIREISAQLRTVHEEAATLFAMYLRDELDSAQMTRIAETVAHGEEEWITRFEKTLTVFTEKGALPHKIFFTADADMVPFFSRLISRAKPELLMGASFDVQYLDQHIIAKFVSFEPEVVRDPFLVVETLLAEKLIGQRS